MRCVCSPGDPSAVVRESKRSNVTRSTAISQSALRSSSHSGGGGGHAHHHRGMGRSVSEEIERQNRRRSESLCLAFARVYVFADASGLTGVDCANNLWRTSIDYIIIRMIYSYMATIKFQCVHTCNDAYIVINWFIVFGHLLAKYLSI